MDAWQYLSLAVAAGLLYLYGLERKKRVQATSERDRAVQDMALKQERDSLTGLKTLEAFEAALEAAARYADLHGSAFSVLSVDLDQLGMLQDGFGEAFGNALIQQAAQRVADSAGKGARLCRGTGGAFLVLVGGGLKVGDMVARRIMAALSEPFVLAERQCHTGCSIGIAVYPVHGTRETMLGNATMAMRMAQHSTGSQCCVYDPVLAAQAREEALLVQDLRQALAEGQFMLYFQPKMEAHSLQVTAAEALLRWRHPQRGMVSPAVFIPLAEKHGLMEDIGRWVIEEACRNAAVWLECGLRMRVAVNLSGYQMHQKDLVEQIEALVQRYGLQAHRFTCEITETVAMEDTEAMQRTFGKMRRAGFHVSIDDFGTGYSSLASLRRLPAAELKIDRAFVMDLETSEAARSIAKSIVDMARALNLKVVAEGVETTGQSDILVDMGCDELQGFLYSMPISAEDLQHMAMSRSTESVEFKHSLFATNFMNELRA